MRILFVSDAPISLEAGNASRMFNISRSFFQHGFDIRVIPIREDLSRFLSGRGRFPTYLRRVLLFFYMMYRLRREKTDLIYSIEFYIGLEAALLSVFFKVRTIYDFGGYIHQEEIHRGHRFKPVLTRCLERTCLRRSDILITQTASNQQALKEFRKKVFVIENGVDLDLMASLSAARSEPIESMNSLRRPIVGFIGNWENWMNIEDLIDVPSHLENASIVIVGQGKTLEGYKKRYPGVLFTGRLPHRKTMALLLDFDICVSPYSPDAIMKYKQAMKTVEYLAAGKPILMSRVEGRESFLREGENCLTYNPGSSSDLARGIREIWDDPVLRERMGRNNLALAKEFTWKKTLERSGLIEALYEGIE